MRSLPSFVCSATTSALAHLLLSFFHSPSQAAIRGVGVISRDAVIFVKRWCVHHGRDVNCL